LLAFPVVDKEKRIVGVVDVGLLADEAFDLAEREETDALFESIGFRISQVRDASPWRAFRYRFPWLMATIASGTICAVLAGFFEVTLAQSLILAFFLTLVLGLGESVSIQSVAVTIQLLRAATPSVSWYVKAFVREVGTAALLGAACGGLVGLIAWVWRGTGMEGLVIGASVFLSLCMACFLGLTVPTVLHALKLDPKLAAGPITLALTDIFTLLFYFGVATIVLR
jgi:magnesium transporter